MPLPTQEPNRTAISSLFCKSTIVYDLSMEILDSFVAAVARAGHQWSWPLIGLSVVAMYDGSSIICQPCCSPNGTVALGLRC